MNIEFEGADFDTKHIQDMQKELICDNFVVSSKLSGADSTLGS
jgi:hypothetical protein